MKIDIVDIILEVLGGIIIGINIDFLLNRDLNMLQMVLVIIATICGLIIVSIPFVRRIVK